MLNAANEVAVAAFLSGRIPFTEVVPVVAAAVAEVGEWPASNLEEVLAADAEARAVAASRISTVSPGPRVG